MCLLTDFWLVEKNDFCREKKTSLDYFQKQSCGGNLKKGVLKNFAKFTEKHLCQSLFFNNLRPATLLKKGLWHRCFPVNFVKILRKPFSIEHLGLLLLYTTRTVIQIRQGVHWTTSVSGVCWFQKQTCRGVLVNSLFEYLEEIPRVISVVKYFSVIKDLATYVIFCGFSQNI